MPKNIDLKEFNENSIIASFKKETSDKEAEEIKEEPKKKRKGATYEELFIRNTEISARHGKGVTIRKEHHDKIQKIIQVIGNNEISIFSYIDNVLNHHFELYKTEITERYKEKNTGIF